MYKLKIKTEQTLFIDIETAAEKRHYIGVGPAKARSWVEKSKKLYPDQHPKDTWRNAALFPEFGKIVCISYGMEVDDRMQTVNLIHDDEKDMLTHFAEKTRKICLAGEKIQWACAHNGMSFDFRFLIIRMLANRIEVPTWLCTFGQKPWDLEYLFDSADLTSFTAWKQPLKLDMLCQLLGVKTPKDAMTGAEVYDYYYDGKINEIAEYCAKDVFAMANCIRVIKGMDQIENHTAMNIGR